MSQGPLPPEGVAELLKLQLYRLGVSLLPPSWSQYHTGAEGYAGKL